MIIRSCNHAFQALRPNEFGRQANGFLKDAGGRGAARPCSKVAKGQWAGDPHAVVKTAVLADHFPSLQTFLFDHERTVTHAVNVDVGFGQVFGADGLQ